MPTGAGACQQLLRDQHQSGMNPDSRLQPGQRPSMNVGIEIAQLLEQCQSRARGALGIVLVRGGIAEVDEDAVAEHLRDESAEPLHDRQRESLVATQQRAEIFRIQSFGQVRGTHQVDELDRQKAAFGSLVARFQGPDSLIGSRPCSAAVDPPAGIARILAILVTRQFGRILIRPRARSRGALSLVQSNTSCRGRGRSLNRPGETARIRVAPRGPTAASKDRCFHVSGTERGVQVARPRGAAKAGAGHLRAPASRPRQAAVALLHATDFRPARRVPDRPAVLRRAPAPRGLARAIRSDALRRI